MRRISLEKGKEFKRELKNTIIDKFRWNYFIGGYFGDPNSRRTVILENFVGQVIPRDFENFVKGLGKFINQVHEIWAEGNYDFSDFRFYTYTNNEGDQVLVAGKFREGRYGGIYFLGGLINKYGKVVIVDSEKEFHDEVECI